MPFFDATILIVPSTVFSSRWLCSNVCVLIKDRILHSFLNPRFVQEKETHCFPFFVLQRQRNSKFTYKIFREANRWQLFAAFTLYYKPNINAQLACSSSIAHQSFLTHSSSVGSPHGRGCIKPLFLSTKLNRKPSFALYLSSTHLIKHPRI